MSHYDPATGRIHASAGASAYAQFHEWAHLGQQATNRLLWRLFRRLHRVPFVGRLINFGLEVEAAVLAIRELQACGIHEPRDTAEAIDGISAYFFDLLPGLRSSTPANTRKR